MNKLKEWTEAYLHIQAMYDGGKSYTWQQARHDLKELFGAINKDYKKIRTPWLRKLAFLLLWEVQAESDRVWALYR